MTEGETKPKLWGVFNGKSQEFEIADADAFLNQPGPLPEKLRDALIAETVKQIKFREGLLLSTLPGSTGILTRQGGAQSVEEIEAEFEPFYEGLQILGIDDPKDYIKQQEEQKRLQEEEARVRRNAIFKNRRDY